MKYATSLSVMLILLSLAFPLLTQTSPAQGTAERSASPERKSADSDFEPTTMNPANTTARRRVSLDMLEQARRDSEAKERTTFETASRIRRLQALRSKDAKTAGQALSLRQDLRDQVAQSFRSRQTLQETELARLAAQLEQARRTIAMRNAFEGQIINRRVEDLLNPKLKWQTNLLPANAVEVPANDSRVSFPSEEFGTSKDNAFVSTQVNTNPNEPPQLELHKQLLTSNVVLSAAIEKGQLSELQLLKSSGDIKTWLRDNLVVRPIGEYSLLLGLASGHRAQADTERNNDEMEQIVHAVREAYEQFIVESHRDVASEVKSLLSAERDDLRQQFLVASMEFKDLDSGESTTDEQLTLAKQKVERLQALLQAVSAKVDAIEVDSGKIDQLQQAISGRWVLRSATIEGMTYEGEAPASEDPFAKQPSDQTKNDSRAARTLESFSRYRTAIFEDDQLSFISSPDGSVDKWELFFEPETDPLKIILVQGETTIGGLLWHGKSQLVLSLAGDHDKFPKSIDDNAAHVLRYDRDETDPQWLKSEAARLRKMATDLLLNGNAGQQETAIEFHELAASMSREAGYREKANDFKTQATESRRLGKIRTAKSLEHDSMMQSLSADEVAATRISDQRLRHDERRVRQKVDQLNSQAASLRGEGRFAEADIVERELQKLLFDRDPDLQQVDQLKRSAAKARLDGKHPDAKLYDEQADELLEQVKGRYKQLDSPEAKTEPR